MSSKSRKLVFKGDKEHKKKKRKHRSSDRDDIGNAPNSDQVWVRADNIEDLVGPLFIVHPSDPLVCLTVDDDNRFLAYPLPENTEEPTIMQQVFVGGRIIGSTDAFSLKSANGKYLSSDKFGEVTCQSEAIGALEEWRPAITDAGIAFQNAHNKFLMADEVAGRGVRIRADADDIGFCETFRVYCQSRFKYKPKTKKKSSDSSVSELDTVRKYQSWGGGKILPSKEDRQKLRKAKEEGRLAETLLDRREKMKADRYCK